MKIDSAMHGKFFHSRHQRVLGSINCIQSRQHLLIATHQLLRDCLFVLIGELGYRRKLKLLVLISNNLVQSLNLVDRRELLSKRLNPSDTNLRDLIVILRAAALSHECHGFILVLNRIAEAWQELSDDTCG